MSAIAWWALPILATLGAIVWASWSARRGSRNIRDYSDSYERFQQAMGQNYRLPEPGERTAQAARAPFATVPSGATVAASAREGSGDTGGTGGTGGQVPAAVTVSPASRLAEVLRERLGSRGAAH